jgi:hypothetical protein
MNDVEDDLKDRHAEDEERRRTQVVFFSKGGRLEVLDQGSFLMPEIQYVKKRKTSVCPVASDLQTGSVIACR